MKISITKKYTAEAATSPEQKAVQSELRKLKKEKAGLESQLKGINAKIDKLSKQVMKVKDEEKTSILSGIKIPDELKTLYKDKYLPTVLDYKRAAGENFRANKGQMSGDAGPAYRAMSAYEKQIAATLSKLADTKISVDDAMAEMARFKPKSFETKATKAFLGKGKRKSK